MESSTSVEVLDAKETIKLYKYRWVVISIFGLYSTVNFAQFMEITIIANILKEYYNVDSLLIDMGGVCFMISFIVFFAPIGYAVEKTSLKTTSIICTGLTFIGSAIKIFATVPGTYYLVLVSQTIISIAQIYMLIIPSKIASSWFGADEVSTACAIGLFGTQIGLAIGGVLPSMLVKNGDEEEVKNGLNQMYILYTIVSGAFFILVILLFRSKPALPPSPSQVLLSTTEKDKQITFWMALKGFAKNKDFQWVLFSFGINYGLWNTFGVLYNQVYTTYFPGNDSDTELGILTCAIIISGGCIGSIIFGYILDRSHNFRLVSFLVLFANLLATIAQAATLLLRSRIGTFITAPIYGFFCGSLMVISYEYTIETTYPIDEAFGASIINVVVYIFAIIFTLILNYVFESIGYLTGFIIIIVLNAIGTFSILLVSPELKRRNANIRSNEGPIH